MRDNHVELPIVLKAKGYSAIMQLRQGITTKPGVLHKIAYIWLLWATLLVNR
jgi:hypothetical protein